MDAQRRLMAEADDIFARVERELHDGIQQRLTTTGLELELIRARLPEGDPARDDLAALGRQLREMAAGVRTLSFRTFPAILTEAGLAPALRSLARHATVPVELDLPPLRRFDALIETTVYRLVADAAGQAREHLTVQLDDLGEALRLTLTTDGAPHVSPVGRDRVEALGGTLDGGIALIPAELHTG
ncbi:histidine kinase [Actinoplanes sp. Pm04-4]|uniref:Histidine kinase n=1 Tax=Paractinoplanes pyxinae TaxID=2997416 RepID=A0ABT4ASB6_9ACTN|nr:histidine kinase [Actinoplanes pyxinae]MCY1137137.1 histidine kinase [Actinoplanes pyxinae]